MIIEVPGSSKPEQCSKNRHVFKETNYIFRRGHSVGCRCGQVTLRMFAYQDVIRDNDPLILWEWEIKPTGNEFHFLSMSGEYKEDK